MIREPANAVHVIIISFIIALALTILPLPPFLIEYRPEWIALVMLYWIMALPQRIGVITAWILGISLDVMKGALLGQHALALAVIAYLMLHMHLRLRMYPFWQQAVVVGVLLTVYQALLLLIYDMTSTINIGWNYWFPSVVGATLWPWLFMVLRDIRRRYKVR